MVSPILSLLSGKQVPMDLSRLVRKHPVGSAICPLLVILASFVEPLWSLFTSDPLVPTIAHWLGKSGVTDISLAWLPWVGVPVGLLMSFAIWREAKKEVTPYTQSFGKTEDSPLCMIGIREQCQITVWTNRELQVAFAVKFENADPTPRFIRRFNAYLIDGKSREKIDRPIRVAQMSPPVKQIDLQAGLSVEPGITGMYYLQFTIPEFSRRGVNFEIEIEALGQAVRRVEFIPEWDYIQQFQTVGNTVKEIRYLN
jgi:hypothetical protein